jgi:hypothetical protein
MRNSIAVAALLLALTAGAAQAQAPTVDPMAGTWKLNVAKSTYATGTGPRAVTYRYTQRPDGFTLWVASTVDTNGNPGFSISLRKYDGRDYPAYNVATMTPLLAENVKTNWTQASRMLDAYTTELVNKTDGAATQKVTRTMARDGKTFTMRTYNLQGEPTSTQLFEKIEPPPTS